MATTKPLSWKPRQYRHKGEDYYCAPACGGGCTLAEYNTALERAQSLAKKLGAGWRAYVHENLGWHYQVHFGEGEENDGRGLVEVSEHMPSDGESVPSYTIYCQTSSQVVLSAVGETELRAKIRSLYKHAEEMRAYWGGVMSLLPLPTRESPRSATKRRK